MSKTRPRPEQPKPHGSKKRRIQELLRQQWMDRELLFFPQPDPPLMKPLG
ncbi:hypothetical protein [Roseateles violae]|uniref:Uncharacterized protein n=1 Tax=Roseateles violae TaxID=3058042 RepID=A0ABT8DP10_9BURK|nr:hypothetical protein [Pelomonas sp. PFR6]MDN3920111.1 hypothetical protein [Pelomonas sp. PFR6]